MSLIINPCPQSGGGGIREILDTGMLGYLENAFAGFKVYVLNKNACVINEDAHNGLQDAFFYQ